MAKQKIFVIENPKAGNFQRDVNEFLEKGWKVSSTSSCINPELNFMVYTAILIKECDK